MEKQLIISVGREFGSGGHEVAQKLADDYGIALYDHDLLKEIAAKKNLKSEDLEAYDELKWNRFLYRTVRGLNSSPEQNVANLQFDFLKEKAKSGESFVVVGRCSETILREYESMVSIFIRGDKPQKAERIMKYYNMNEKDALGFMKEKDKRRKQYPNRYCPIAWGDPRNYDLVVNSSRVGVDGCVEQVKHYIDLVRKYHK